MITPPGVRQNHWQSLDALMETGTSTLAGQTYGYINLGPRSLSNCPGFSLSEEEEQQGLVFEAGHYRSLQQQRKEEGGLILSYLEEIAVGGIYLMHGLSAQYRVAAENTVFYDTVPSRPPVPLHQVETRGLLDEIIPIGTLELWLTTTLNKYSRSTEL
jgi:hypothetical protein